MEGFFVILTMAICASIPITAMVLYHKRKTGDTKIKELELQKEIIKLEIEKQNGTVRLLEEENKKLDKVIDE